MPLFARECSRVMAPATLQDFAGIRLLCGKRQGVPQTPRSQPIRALPWPLLPQPMSSEQANERLFRRSEVVPGSWSLGNLPGGTRGPNSHLFCSSLPLTAQQLIPLHRPCPAPHPGQPGPSKQLPAFLFWGASSFPLSWLSLFSDFFGARGWPVPVSFGAFSHKWSRRPGAEDASTARHEAPGLQRWIIILYPRFG